MSTLDQQALQTLNAQVVETAEPSVDAELAIEITPVEPNLESSSDVAQVFPCR